MKQINSNRPKAMDKETFMQQYVLNRANTVEGRMSGIISTIEASEAWNLIQEHLVTKSDGGSDE